MERVCRPDVFEGDACGAVDTADGFGVWGFVDADAATSVAGDVGAEPGDLVYGQAG
jgi:hypothetical protein